MVTWIAFIALIVSIIGFAYTWKLHQELNTATRRLDRYNKALFDAEEDVRRLRDELAEATTKLRVAIKQGGQQPYFSADMSVREAQLLHPQAAQIMAGLHLGGCSSCAVDADGHRRGHLVPGRVERRPRGRIPGGISGAD